VRRWRVKYIK